MAFQILLNFLIAILWMFLLNEWTAANLVVGYIIGIGVLIALRRFWNERLYIARGWALVKLTGMLLRELFISSYQVVKAVIFPDRNIHPGIFTYTTELKTDREVAMLTGLLCLTPGSMALEVSGDNRTFYIHSMNISNPEKARLHIRNTFERAISEVTRP